jgi:hypothetical protein
MPGSKAKCNYYAAIFTRAKAGNIHLSRGYKLQPFQKARPMVKYTHCALGSGIGARGPLFEKSGVCLGLRLTCPF